MEQFGWKYLLVKLTHFTTTMRTAEPGSGVGVGGEGVVENIEV